MNTLWTFGCSYTQGFVEGVSTTYEEYKKNFCGDVFPNSWPSILSEKLNLDLKNFGGGANSNQQIFEDFCKNLHLFKKDDIIIIGWTFLERYRLALNKDEWLKLGPGKVAKSSPISQECHDSLIVNRTLDPYIKEIYNYEKIIDKVCDLISINVYYWTIINELIYNQPKEVLNNKKYLLNDYIHDNFDNTFTVMKKFNGFNILEETNGQIDDVHQGSTGHEVQAKLFYDHILKYNTKFTNI